MGRNQNFFNAHKETSGIVFLGVDPVEDLSVSVSDSLKSLYFSKKPLFITAHYFESFFSRHLNIGLDLP